MANCLGLRLRLWCAIRLRRKVNGLGLGFMLWSGLSLRIMVWV